MKVHDFEDKELGKVVPYGVYDVGANAGWVSVGITHDTAEFAVACDPPLARADGARSAIPRHARADDHRRLRRLQRGARPAVEGRAAEARRRDRPHAPVSTTIRRARPSGTRSSTACSATSRRTGAAGR